MKQDFVISAVLLILVVCKLAFGNDENVLDHSNSVVADGEGKEETQNEDVFDRFYFVGENPLDHNIPTNPHTHSEDIPITTDEIRKMLQTFKKIEKEQEDLKSQKHNIQRRSLNAIPDTQYLHSLRHRRDIEAMQEIFDVQDDSIFEDLEDKRQRMKELENQPEELKKIKQEVRELILHDLSVKMYPDNENARDVFVNNFRKLHPENLYQTALKWGVIKVFDEEIFGTKVEHRSKRQLEDADYEVSYSHLDNNQQQTGDENVDDMHFERRTDLGRTKDEQSKFGSNFDKSTYKDIDEMKENLTFDDEEEKLYDVEIENPLEGIKVSETEEDELAQNVELTEHDEHIKLDDLLNDVETKNNYSPLSSGKENIDTPSSSERKEREFVDDAFGERDSTDSSESINVDDLYLMPPLKNETDEQILIERLTGLIINKTMNVKEQKYQVSENTTINDINLLPSNTALILKKKIESLKEATRNHPLLQFELNQLLQKLETLLKKKEFDIKERSTNVQKGLSSHHIDHPVADPKLSPDKVGIKPVDSSDDYIDNFIEAFLDGLKSSSIMKDKSTAPTREMMEMARKQVNEKEGEALEKVQTKHYSDFKLNTNGVNNMIPAGDNSIDELENEKESILSNDIQQQQEKLEFGLLKKTENVYKPIVPLSKSEGMRTITTEDGDLFKRLTSEQKNELSSILQTWQEQKSQSNLVNRKAPTEVSGENGEGKSNNGKREMSIHESIKEENKDADREDVSLNEDEKSHADDVFEHMYDNTLDGIDKNEKENYIDDEVDLSETSYGSEEKDINIRDAGNEEEIVDTKDVSDHHKEVLDADLSYLKELKSVFSGTKSVENLESENEYKKNDKKDKERINDVGQENFETLKNWYNDKSQKFHSETKIPRESHIERDGKYTSILKTAKLLNNDHSLPESLFSADVKKDTFDRTELDYLRNDNDQTSGEEFTPGSKPLKGSPPDQLILGRLDSKQGNHETEQYSPDNISLKRRKKST